MVQSGLEIYVLAPEKNLCSSKDEIKIAMRKEMCGYFFAEDIEFIRYSRLSIKCNVCLIIFPKNPILYALIKYGLFIILPNKSAL